MNTPLYTHSTTVNFPYGDDYGNLVSVHTYATNGEPVLQWWSEDGEMDTFSINLDAYDMPSLPDGQFYIKNWSEHRGVAEALAAAGFGKIVNTVLVGPFESEAFVFQLGQ